MNESIVYLYLASGLPILIVPFLPDFKTNQYIRSDKSGGNVTIVRTSAGGEELIAVQFKPGTIIWKKRWLYLQVQELESAPAAVAPPDSAVSLSVLYFDLQPHPRKRHWIGVRLENVATRTEGLSYTTDEVGRLLIRAVDLAAATEGRIAIPVSSGKDVQA